MGYEMIIYEQSCQNPHLQFQTMNEISDEVYKKRKIAATTLASPLASLIAKFVTYPIDTIKTKVQADPMSLRNITSYKVGHSFELIKSTFRDEGVRGFYPGVTLAAFGSIIAFSVYMTAYEKSKSLLEKNTYFKEHSTLNHLVSGLVAEFFSCSLWLPIDIIKERMQVQREVKIYKYEGPRDAMKKIQKTQGFIGLYRAFGATLMFFGPFSALFFMFYEKIKKEVVKDEKNPTIPESIICSSGAGAIAGFITTPLEMVKMRMQIQRADSSMKGIPLEKTIYGYRNIFHGLQLVAKNQGLLALYKGAGLRVLFVVPITTLSLTLTQSFRSAVMQTHLPDYFI